MQPILTILSLVLLLSACKMTGPEEAATQQSSSSIGQLSSSSLSLDENAYRGVDEEQPVLEVWHTIEAWTPAIPWFAPKEGTNDEDIIIDDAQNSIPAGMVQAASIAADIDQEVFERVFMESDSRDALDASLQQRGWGRHLPIDADGPMGTRWGYRRDAAEGMRFLAISALCTDMPDDPSIACPQWEATAQVTAAIAPGDDL